MKRLYLTFHKDGVSLDSNIYFSWIIIHSVQKQCEQTSFSFIPRSPMLRQPPEQCLCWSGCIAVSLQWRLCSFGRGWGGVGGMSTSLELAHCLVQRRCFQKFQFWSNLDWWQAHASLNSLCILSICKMFGLFPNWIMKC